MSRGKAINVKIATPKVIKALETKLAQVEADYKKQDENEAKFQKSLEKWRKEVAKFATANISKAENLRTNYRSWNKTLNVDFDLTCSEGEFPTEPQRDFEVLHTHTYNEMKEEIENAIRILKMTDEEVVSTSTYNAIARYL
jgi:septal ring factor EnvC (AmiA/AmiB activator)